jgi:hypothetical protein
MVAEMRRLLAEAPERTGLLNLKMREIEHSLCEFDKYMRTVRARGGRGLHSHHRTRGHRALDGRNRAWSHPTL